MLLSIFCKLVRWHESHYFIKFDVWHAILDTFFRSSHLSRGYVFEKINCQNKNKCFTKVVEIELKSYKVSHPQIRHGFHPWRGRRNMPENTASPAQNVCTENVWCVFREENSVFKILRRSVVWYSIKNSSVSYCRACGISTSSHDVEPVIYMESRCEFLWQGRANNNLWEMFWSAN